jgi:C4-dicarboxylate transporter, DctQ subunit
MRDSSLLRGLARLEYWWNWIEQVTVGLLGLAALGFGVVQVVGRYVAPHQAIAYAEELIVYLVVWAIMISSSQLVRRDGHVRSDLVVRLVSPGQRRWLEVFNCLVALVFVAGLWWYGQQVVDTAVLLDERSSSDLQFPKWIYYAALPTAGALMMVRYLIRLLKFVFFYDSKTMTIGHIPAHETGLLSTDGNIETVRT